MASPLTAHADISLGQLLPALRDHDDKALVLTCEGGEAVRAGYHITEVKAGRFVTLDCGGNPDAWQETVLQVEDIPPAAGQSFMRVRKFRAILDKVAQRVELDAGARVTFEVSRPNEAMRIYDVAEARVEDERIVLRLATRPAICKPRHRAADTSPVSRPSSITADVAAAKCCG